MLINLQAVAIYLLAIAVAVCGTSVLQTAWRSKKRKWHLVLAGWALVFASLTIWSFTTTSDKGIALGITAWVMIALFFLLRSAMQSPVRAEREQRKQKTRNEATNVNIAAKSRLASNAFTVILIGPLAGLATMLLSTLLLVLMRALHVEYTANLAIASMLFPILWAALAVGLGYQQRLTTRLFTVFSIGAGSLLCLWLVS
jgi:hypothetical protein